ncbi:MAG TPA: hypothetical protein VGP47_05110 [Parachlamydiaceae bacterium]|nr:hypothetical protein [Parachlamydiaceae bacterium]
MKKHFGKFLVFMLAVAYLASPLSLMAATTFKDVAGTYQISGFSNSFPGAPLGIQSQAVVGQVTFNSDGTVVVPFVNFTVVTIAGTVISTPFTNVQGVYTLGPVDGQGSLTLFNFPTQGANPQFAISFKRHCQKIVGFSALTTVNTTSNLWTLIQGERFN